MTSKTLARSAALAASGALLVPAGALAAGPSVVAGPLKAKGYDITLSGSGSSLSIIAARTSGGSTQMHTWSFANANVGARGITASLGRYGSVSLRFSGGRTARGSVPTGCTGTPGRTRVGVMTGKLKLALDTTYFKTITARRTKGQVATGGTLQCGAGGGQSSGGTVLSVTDQGSAGMLMLSISRVGAEVSQTIMRTDDAASAAPASVSHMIIAKAQASGLDAAADLTSATAAAAGPFLSGSLSFAGQPMSGMATGTVSGSFAAKFDSIGTQSLPADATALLTRR